MSRVGSRTLVLGGLVALLAACGQVPGGAGGISGTVRAPAGGDVVNTDVFACFNNEENCERLGTTTITQQGASAAYRLGALPGGSYGVYAFKDSDNDSLVDNGEFFGFHSSATGAPVLIRPPATGVNIVMTRLTGVTSAPLRASIAEVIADN